MEKPKTLYRGIILNYDTFKSFDLINQSLIVPYEPIIDGLGRKVTTDGNEYGVYTTTNKDMCYKLYGNPHNVGKVLDYTLQSNGIVIDVPDIGIIYEIDTDNLDVRKPFKINEDSSDDWIAESISTTNYKVKSIKIGEDFLHSAEQIDVDDIENSKKIVIEKLDKRIEHLKNLIPYLKSLPIITIREIGKHKEEKFLYRYIYGYDGVYYTDIDSIDVSDYNGMLKYLFYSFYKENKSNNIPLRYIINLESKLSKTKDDKVKEMINIIVSDINDAKRRRENSLKKGKDVSGFDEKIKMLHQMLEIMKKGLEVSEHNK